MSHGAVEKLVNSHKDDEVDAAGAVNEKVVNGHYIYPSVGNHEDFHGSCSAANDMAGNHDHDGNCRMVVDTVLGSCTVGIGSRAYLSISVGDVIARQSDMAILDHRDFVLFGRDVLPSLDFVLVFFLFFMDGCMDFVLFDRDVLPSLDFVLVVLLFFMDGCMDFGYNLPLNS